jgi:SAM-dependent methyltransferase
VVLVVGGSILGKGMDALMNEKNFTFIETDVSFGPRTTVICDAHDLPFQDGSIDCVILQAVLEHVVSPYRCVEETFRVLKKEGLVYAETPFMQQVHMGKYDFTRFTHLGHRRLFRGFREIKSGVVAGPGTALAWAYQYFLASFVETKLLRHLVIAFARSTSFFLKYFDYYLANKPGSMDAASCFYFFGKKSAKILSDDELLKLYKGSFFFS